LRAVLDPNVYVSGLLSPAGAPAAVLRAWRRGRFEVVVSPLLLTELERVLAYPKLRKRISVAQAAAFLSLLTGSAEAVPDTQAKIRTADPDDDYLIALAQQARAAVVSGDRHVLDLADRLPIFTARQWIDSLDR
jgi:putative PIN family toxin of toxin-antitoxin system